MNSAFAMFSSKPLNFVEPLVKTSEDNNIHLETLIGETLVS